MTKDTKGTKGTTGRPLSRAFFLCVLCILGVLVSAQQSIPVRVVEKGDQSNVDGARQAVARTEAEWTAIWKQHNFDRPAPKVDFSKEMVVAVFMGSRPSAGFTTEIVGVEPSGGELVVRYKETMPGADRLTAQILTAPYFIAAIPRRTGTVTFEKVKS